MHGPTRRTPFGRQAKPTQVERGFVAALCGLRCESTRREYRLGWVQGAEMLRAHERAGEAFAGWACLGSVDT